MLDALKAAPALDPALFFAKRGVTAPPPPRACEGGAAAAVAALVNHTIFRKDAPVLSVKIFKRTAVICKMQTLESTPDRLPRGDIWEQSDKSRLRMYHFLMNCDRTMLSMITLTMPAAFEVDGSKVKRMLDGFLRNPLFDGVGIVWFMEFQKRGAPHFHLLTTLDLSSLGGLTTRTRVRSASSKAYYRTHRETELSLAARWAKIVAKISGRAVCPVHSRVGLQAEVLLDNDAAVKYASAHAAKVSQKTVPPGYERCGRFWGSRGLDTPEALFEDSATTANIFQRFGGGALSSSGRVKRVLVLDQCKPIR